MSNHAISPNHASLITYLLVSVQFSRHQTRSPAGSKVRGRIILCFEYKKNLMTHWIYVHSFAEMLTEYSMQNNSRI